MTAAVRATGRLSTSDAPSPPNSAEVRAALERIAGSLQLRTSPRLVAFLRHVVERTLAGRCAEIKSYTIAVEAFGRNPSFDPQADPIVRVEAGRLRHALAHYYADAGRNDPLVIELPRGSYVPLFHERARAIGGDSEQRATFQAVSDRLIELRRQIEAMAEEIEIAKATLEQPDPMQRRRN